MTLRKLLNTETLNTKRKFKKYSESSDRVRFLTSVIIAFAWDERSVQIQRPHYEYYVRQGSHPSVDEPDIFIEPERVTCPLICLFAQKSPCYGLFMYTMAPCLVFEKGFGRSSAVVTALWVVVFESYSTAISPSKQCSRTVERVSVNRMESENVEYTCRHD